MARKYWFNSKDIGYGWTPITWQGWAVIGVYLVVIAFFISEILDRANTDVSPFTYVIKVIAASIVLVVICMHKGEKRNKKKS